MKTTPKMITMKIMGNRKTGHHQRVHPIVFLNSYLLSIILFSVLLLMATLPGTHGSEEDCPWAEGRLSASASGGGRSTTTSVPAPPRVPPSIKTNCLCARNPSLNLQLSIQCFEIEAQQLVSLLIALRINKETQPLELLYLNASKVTDVHGQVPQRIFRDLKMVSLQLSGCEIKSLHPEAFRGQESQLKHLSLTQNLLADVPSSTLERLRHLGLLDLSYNKLTKISQGSFEKLTKLGTLKLNDNNLELGANAFKGLENSLRNLNLKGTRLSIIPSAISNLSSLAFLDLAQNRLRELDPLPFVQLHSLTALNLERNLLQSLPATVFTGVNDTLSSLSLLNNLITHFPREALQHLKELRVLDLGFNLLTEIPTNAFNGLNTLTLLALDGNPLTTLPLQSFQSLNSTLRGISIGSRFLSCDCHLRWVAEWIRDYELQVTSRERSPQFCGSPQELREFSFYQLKPTDFKCENESIISSSTSKSTTTEYNLNLSPSDLALLGLDSNYFGKDNHDDELEVTSGESDESSAYNDYSLPTTGIDSSQNVTKPSRQSSSGGARRRTNGQSTLPSSTPNSLESTHEEDDDDIDSIKPSTFRPSIRPSVLASTTKRTLQPIKPFLYQRSQPPKQQSPKVITSTTTTMSSSSSSTTANTARNHSTAFNNNNSNVIAKPKPTSSVASITPVQITKPKPTVGLMETELDESKIPIITGIGPSRLPTNTGTVISVKLPTSPTTTSTTGTPIRIIQSTTTTSSINSGSGGSGSGSVSGSGSSYYQPPTHHQHHHVRPTNLIFADKSADNIVIRQIERSGENIVIQWEGEKQTVYRVVYRLFGDEIFKRSPPLAASEREYLLQNIPQSECVVVCVVPYEEIVYDEISPATIPPGSQCRELRPHSPFALMNHMDKITIGASAAICLTVLLAVLIFIGITKHAKNRRPPPSIIAKVPLGSFTSPSPGPTTIITTTTTQPSSLNNNMKEWDQMSALSVRSIPRAQIYHPSLVDTSSGGPIIGHGPARPILPPQSYADHHHHQQRTVPDGHSTHRSYLSSHHAHHNHSMQSYTKPSNNNRNVNMGSSNYLNNQSRLLRASVGSRTSQDALKKQNCQQQQRQYEQNQRRKKRMKRLSQSDSVNTLSGYESPDTNWTDHDMDVYVTRNHATRRDLVNI